MNPLDSAAGREAHAESHVPRTIHIPLDRIATDNQVRKVFDEEKIRSLAMSLQAEGQLQPILVYFDAERDVHVVLAGERRLRAARLIGMTGLDAVVYPRKLSPSEIAIVQISENTLREGLDPIELAQGFRELIERDGCTQKQLAERLHLAESTVGRALSLLELPGDLQEEIRNGELSPTIAREIARMPEEEHRRTTLAQVRTEGLNAAHTSKLVTKLLNAKKKSPRKTKPAKTTFRLEGKHQAVITKKSLRLTPPPGKKEWTPSEQVHALRSLAQRIEDELVNVTQHA